jgi:hypothetical protein
MVVDVLFEEGRRMLKELKKKMYCKLGNRPVGHIPILEDRRPHTIP